MKRAVLALVLGLAACGGEDAPRAAAASPVVVDSALPMDEALRRFHASIEEPAPERLSGGEATMDALLSALLRAYAERDAGTLEALAMTRAEFGHLYYPESPYPEEPYRLQPEFLWYLIEQRGARGVERAVQRYGGRDAAYAGHACPTPPKEEGDSLLWGPCFVTVRLDGTAEEVVRLANAVVERDGRFKLVGFDNQL